MKTAEISLCSIICYCNLQMFRDMISSSIYWKLYSFFQTYVSRKLHMIAYTISELSQGVGN